jgi:hypothetical protein
LWTIVVDHRGFSKRCGSEGFDLRRNFRVWLGDLDTEVAPANPYIPGVPMAASSILPIDCSRPLERLA